MMSLLMGTRNIIIIIRYGNKLAIVCAHYHTRSPQAILELNVDIKFRYAL